MIEVLRFASLFVAGVLLGAIFFGGLWWTVRKGAVSPWPFLWFFCSFWLRLGVALGGFYFVGGEDWRRLVLCLAGFALARPAVQLLTRAPEPVEHGLAKDVNHAT
jgi:F1F0 ATPase subunit 2